MTVICSGDNPRLTAAQDRFSKTLEGLSKEYSNGQEIGTKDFWILLTENTNSITVGSTKTQVTEIEFEQKTDVQKVGLMFTCEGQLSATAVVDLEITVDDEASYTFDVTEEKAGKGKRIFTADCGFRVLGKGTHTAKVYLTVTDNSLKWSDLV
jgi:cytoskeletal protein RodZ